MIPDLDKISEAIIKTDTTIMAKEAAFSLVEGWLRKFHDADSKLSIHHVELGFSIWLDTHTLIVGVQDMIAEDASGILGNEWKTTAEPTKWWTEGRWLTEIGRGPQLAVYALALNRGTFYEQHAKKVTQFTPKVTKPRIRVRAAVKSEPPSYWPTSAAGIFTYTPARLESTAQALLVRADSIRSARATSLVPWQITGKHCEQFNRLCPYFKDCNEGKHTTTPAVSTFDPSDPATKLALSRMDPELLLDPQLVILSASSYDLSSQCMEKYRIISGSYGEKKSDIALDTGTCFHAGVAEYYRQLRVHQEAIRAAVHEELTNVIPLKW